MHGVPSFRSFYVQVWLEAVEYMLIGWTGRRLYARSFLRRSNPAVNKAGLHLSNTGHLCSNSNGIWLHADDQIGHGLADRRIDPACSAT